MFSLWSSNNSRAMLLSGSVFSSSLNYFSMIEMSLTINLNALQNALIVTRVLHCKVET